MNRAAYTLAVSAAPFSSQVRRAVLQACSTASDARSLRIAVLEQIARVVDFDAYAWLLTDPRTSVGTSPVADVPWLPELPRQIRLKYQTPVNRWTRLKRDPVALLHNATRGNLAASLVWRELLSDYGIGDVASIVFRDRFGCWAFLELWRSQAQGSFSHDEAAFMADIAPSITLALRRTQALTFAAGSPRDDSVPGPVVLLLSPDLEVRAQTPETQAYLRLLVPPAEGRTPVPATAYNVGAQLLSVEAQVDLNQPHARVHIAESLWVTARAARIADERLPADSDIAVTMERSTPAERADMFGRVFGLSRRETELLDHLALGQDTREMARAMFVSENTVQDHLKSIFAKTGTHNRRTLLAQAVGT